MHSRTNATVEDGCGSPQRGILEQRNRREAWSNRGRGKRTGLAIDEPIRNLERPQANQANPCVFCRGWKTLRLKQSRIAQLTAQGYKNSEIAKLTGITELVTRQYLMTIFDKLGVWNRVELALKVIHHEMGECESR